VSSAAQESQRPAPVKLRPNHFTNVPTYKPSSPALNVVLLDTLNTAVPRQNFAREELAHFLEKWTPGQPIAIYVLGEKLRLAQDFTDDPEVLKSAVARLKAASSARLENPAGGPPFTVANATLDATPAAMKQRIKEMMEDSAAFVTADRVRTTLDALSSIARHLAAYPGRKKLIWISDTFPFNVTDQLGLKAATRLDLQADNHVSDHLLMDSQVAIYPVDAHSLQVPFFHDVGIGNPRDLGVKAANSGAKSLEFMSEDFGNHLDVHTTMNDLAAKTGGRAFYYDNDLQAAIRHSISDGSTYYTIGYYPQDKNWDGQFRKIEIKVDRAGAKIHHRQGYFALEPGAFLKQDQQKRLLALHQMLDLNVPVSTTLLFQAAVLGPSLETQNRLVVNFGIDPRAISFEKDTAGRENASVECAVAAYSEQGTLIKSDASTVNASLLAAEFDRVNHSFFPCQETIDLPAGSYTLRLGVLDHHSGLIGTANASAVVSATNSPAPSN
jgi:VWFA-related protein